MRSVDGTTQAAKAASLEKGMEASFVFATADRAAAMLKVNMHTYRCCISCCRMLPLIFMRDAQHLLPGWRMQHPLNMHQCPSLVLVDSWVDCLTGCLIDWLTERTSVWHVMQ